MTADIEEDTVSLGVQIVFDAHDPGRVGRFWAAALGYREDPPPPGYDSWEAFATDLKIPKERWNDKYGVSDPDGNGPRIFIQKVPEAKTLKNRLHLDIRASGGRTVHEEERIARMRAKAEELVAEGASFIEECTEMGEFWIVMADPEGNEFCVT